MAAMLNLSLSNRSIGYKSLQWRAEGGANDTTAPGIHPGGHPRASFRKQM